MIIGIAVGVLVVAIVVVAAFTFGYATGCMTGRAETMDLYNNDEQP